MKLWSLIIPFLIAGCTLIPPNPDHFHQTKMETQYLTFTVWEKDTIQPGQPIRLYFEGNGNPNPYHKIALNYAKQDPSNNVIYIAQPCQWSQDKICKTTPEIYQSQRYHPEIIREIEELVLDIMNKYQTKTVEFVGYDGGATVAMDIAVHIQPVRIITIAGILDLNAYVRQNDVEITEDAINPADRTIILATIPQIHYVGTEDNVTPVRVAEKFVSNMQNPKSAIVKKVRGADHYNWDQFTLDY